MTKEMKTMADEDKNTDPFAGFNTVKGDGDGGTLPAEPPKSEKSAKPSTPPAGDEGDPDPLAAFRDSGDGDQDDDDGVPPDDEGEDDGDDGSENELSDNEDDGDGSEDDDESDDEDSGDDGAGEGEDGERPSKAKTRIAQLTKARRDAERRAAAAERRLAEIEAERQKPKSKDQDDTPPAEDEGDEPEIEVKDAKGNVLAEPDPKKYKYGEVDSQYLKDVVKYQAAYARALTAHEAEQTRRAEAADQQRQEVQQKWTSTLERGAEVHDDFEEVVLASAERDEWSLTKTMFEVATESELGHEMLYHLAKNPAQSDKIAKMTERDQARYLGRLEAALETSLKGKDKDTIRRKKPSASPPPSRRSPRGKGGKFVNPARSENFADFEAHVERARSKSTR
jgi:hypothetical protein